MRGDFKRQVGIFNPELYKDIPVVVIGAGGIGSGVLMGLAKMGVSNITIFDHDSVEKHNIPNQFYTNSQIGTAKVNAAKDMIEDFSPSGVVADIHMTKAEEGTQIPVNCLMIFAVDSLAARKELLTSSFMQRAKYLIDARMGGNVISVYNVNPRNKKDLAEYTESLNVTPHKTSCAAQAISYTILMTAGIVCSAVRNTLVGNTNPYQVVFDAENFMLQTYAGHQHDASPKRERTSERV